MVFQNSAKKPGEWVPDFRIICVLPTSSSLLYWVMAVKGSFTSRIVPWASVIESDKYFDIAKYPKMTFVSKSISRINAKKYKLTGDLTLHGVTKTVSLELTYNGTGKSMRTQKPVAGFKVTGTINRNDFGVGHAPGAIISEDIDIKANGEFEQAI